MNIDFRFSVSFRLLGKCNAWSLEEKKSRKKRGLRKSQYSFSGIGHRLFQYRHVSTFTVLSLRTTVQKSGTHTHLLCAQQNKQELRDEEIQKNQPRPKSSDDLALYRRSDRRQDGKGWCSGYWGSFFFLLVLRILN